MKLIAFSILSVLLFECTGSQNKVPDQSADKKDNILACLDIDTALLEYVKDFDPRAIDLDESLSPRLKQFINTIDTTCLRRQKQYKYFIISIVAKLYRYQVTCCKIGYNLIDMKEGAAKTIINEYQNLIGYPGKREFLNSGTVIAYIKQDSLLREDKMLKEIIKQVGWD